MSSISPQDYYKLPTESIPEYNARIAKLRGLSGTQNQIPNQPMSQPSLPDAQQSPLLSFADTLKSAVNLARQKRNESSLGMMAPFQGTVAASDFNSILSNLNRASDTTAKDLIETATEQVTPATPELRTVGDTVYALVPDPSSPSGFRATVVVGEGGDSSGQKMSYEEWLNTREGQQAKAELEKSTSRLYTSDSRKLKVEEGLKSKYAQSSTRSINKKANYSASTVPDDVRSELLDDISKGADLKSLYAAYPDVSTDYIRSLYSSLNEGDSYGGL